VVLFIFLSPAREPINMSATLGSVASLGFGANDSAKIQK